MRQKTARLIKSDGLQRQAGRLRQSNQMATKRFDTENFNLDELLGLTPAAGSNEQAETEQEENAEYQYEPEDYSDIGQAEVYAHVYYNWVRFNKSTGFLVYDGVKWNIEANESTKAHGFAQDLTDAQLEEIGKGLQKTVKKRVDGTARGNAAMIEEADKEEKRAKRYLSFVRDRRKSKGIRDTLKEVEPKLLIDVKMLDKDPYLLNCPGGTVNLRTGKMREHDWMDYCTKCTGVDPSDTNRDMFESFLDDITGGDVDLKEYLQLVAGMCAIGEVRIEKLISAYGKGGNGKSTLVNLLGMVFGDYYGNISPDILMKSDRGGSNADYEKADLLGKRLVVAGELNEGKLMDTAALKRITSTDNIHARQIYKTPITFKPSHTLLMHTNHLPKVDTTDAGTWDRLVIVPFVGRFRGTKKERKNYAEELFSKCGGAVLQWVIDGARKFIENGYMLPEPECVKAAIAEFRSENDWTQQFIAEKCTRGEKYRIKRTDLYNAYKIYATAQKDIVRGKKDFRQAMNEAGFPEDHKEEGDVYLGITLNTRVPQEETQPKGEN